MLEGLDGVIYIGWCFKKSKKPEQCTTDCAGLHSLLCILRGLCKTSPLVQFLRLPRGMRSLFLWGQTQILPACSSKARPFGRAEGSFIKLHTILSGREALPNGRTPALWAGSFYPRNTQCMPAVKIFVLTRGVHAPRPCGQPDGCPIPLSCGIALELESR